ncbi:hypothetical protein PcaKH35_37790 (plasmid) [Parageobacillus caldoxylosilyticus]|nr:hypothetical protein PcaKH35_37790 [Parageobacillus caldoxylosilyticus]
MTIQESLQRYKGRYEEAMEVQEPRRSILLAAIMTDMENEFRIPVLSMKRAEEEVHPEVLQLYRKISDSRSIWK